MRPTSVVRSFFVFPQLHEKILKNATESAIRVVEKRNGVAAFARE